MTHHLHSGNHWLKQSNIAKFMVVTLQIKYVFFKPMEAIVSMKPTQTKYSA